MKVRVNYTTLNTSVLFEVTKKERQKFFTLDVISPQPHICEKKHKTLLNVATHIHLSNQASQVFLMAYGLNEKDGIDSVDLIEFTVTKADISCDH